MYSLATPNTNRYRYSVIIYNQIYIYDIIYIVYRYIYQNDHDDETNWFPNVCLSVRPSLDASYNLSKN